MNELGTQEPTEPVTLLTPGDVCRRLNISRTTLSTWARDGVIPSIQLPGGHRRYRPADVEAIERGEVPA
jgi:excisionase family DNA binding protein